MKAIFLAAAAAFQVGDVWTTNRFLALGDTEGNPVMAWLQAAMGDAWVLPKLLVAVAAVLIVSRARTVRPALFLACLGAMTVVNNLLVIAGH